MLDRTKVLDSPLIALVSLIPLKDACTHLSKNIHNLCVSPLELMPSCFLSDTHNWSKVTQNFSLSRQFNQQLVVGDGGEGRELLGGSARRDEGRES